MQADQHEIYHALAAGVAAVKLGLSYADIRVLIDSDGQGNGEFAAHIPGEEPNVKFAAHYAVGPLADVLTDGAKDLRLDDLIKESDMSTRDVEIMGDTDEVSALTIALAVKHLTTQLGTGGTSQLRSAIRKARDLDDDTDLALDALCPRLAAQAALKWAETQVDECLRPIMRLTRSQADRMPPSAKTGHRIEVTS